MKVVLISDSHGRHESIYVMKPEDSVSNIETLYHISGMLYNHMSSVYLPHDADMIIHGGDMSMMGEEYEIDKFLKWYSNLPYKYKILIAGNHDYLFEKQRGIAKEVLKKYPNIIYLESSEVVIEGIKIYGEPRQPWFHSWAFNVERGEAIKRYWDAIPDDVDILVTHGPPYDILDMTARGASVGCVDLRNRIKELKNLKLCIFGHIHEHAGYEFIDGVHFVNASVLNLRYQLQNRPQAFIIDKEKNIKKIDLMETENKESVEEFKFPNPSIKAQVQFDDLLRMDIRMCSILSAEKVEGKDKLYKLEINTGVDKRIVVSAIAHQIEASQLVGYVLPFILNLPPRKIAGIESNGMIILSENQGGKYFLPGDPDTEVGSIVI
jgi:methionine--tRNA ligase beta chain